MKERILQLRKEGKMYKEISDILGCSKGTISYHCGENQKEKSNARTKKNRKDPKKRLNYLLNKRYQNIFVRDEKKNKNIKKHREKTKFSFSEFKEHILKHSICYITGKKLNLEDTSTWQIDHIIPLFKGGETTLENIRPVTKEGNRAKSDLLLEDFLELCKESLIHNGYNVNRDGVEPPE